MTTVEALALRLRDAYSGGAIGPLRDGLAPTDAEGAYAVQEVNTRFWEAEGRRIVGRKAGLTAKAVQVQLGVDQPDFGVLFEDMRIADGGALDPARTLQPKAEAEIAFILGHDLPDLDTSPQQAAAGIASVHAAIEIVDSRIADWKITFADTVADNGSSAFFVLADEGRPLPGTDIYSAGMVMEVKAIIVLNPAEPPLIMRDTVYCLCEEADLEAIRASIEAMVAEVQTYVPGYRMKQAVQFEHIGSNRPLHIPEMDGDYTGLKVSVFLEVEGAAHYLPAYAGNLDIMTSAALRTAEKIAQRMHEGAVA